MTISTTPIKGTEWGSRYRAGTSNKQPLPISEFWLHHSATIAPDLVPPFTDDDAAVRQLEAIGQQRFGTGISYNFPITPVGRIYEGVPVGVVGSHTYLHNTPGVAFCLVGNYDKVLPTAAQEFLVAFTMVRLFREGKASRFTLNGGHRDVFGTECPGNAAYSRIAAINNMAVSIHDGTYNYEDGMATEQEIVQAIFLAEVGRTGKNFIQTIDRIRTNTEVAVTNSAAALALAQQSAASQGGLSLEQVQAASKAGVDEALASYRLTLEKDETLKP